MKDPYEIFGVERTASAADVQKAYRRACTARANRRGGDVHYRLPILGYPVLRAAK